MQRDGVSCADAVVERRVARSAKQGSKAPARSRHFCDRELRKADSEGDSVCEGGCGQAREGVPFGDFFIAKGTVQRGEVFGQWLWHRSALVASTAFVHRELLMSLLWGLALAADPFALPTTVEVLPNGLTVIVAEDHRTDTVALHITYGVGSRDEQPGELGCAHLFEHLMFEGSANVPNNAFDQWLTEAGGSNNAYTSEDVTAYHMTFPSGGLDLALFLESDRLGFLEAGIDDVNLKNQQGVVLQERAEGYAEPNGRDWDAVTRLTNPPDHPYHHPVIGTVADINGFEVAGVVDFWRRHYRSRNAVMAIVGNVDTQETLERVRFWFSDVPDAGEPVPRVTAEMPSPVQGALGLLEDDVEERTLWLVWQAVPLQHVDEPAIDVMVNVLSNGRGTRLDDALYYESKLAGQVGMFAPMSELSGQIIAVVGSDKTALTKLEKKVRKEVEMLVEKPPTDQELARARTAIRGWMLDEWEEPADVASVLVDCYRSTGEAACLAKKWARYETVTSADVVRVAQKYLLDAAPNALSNVPKGDDGALPGSVPVELP
jgi:zinc protease